MSVPHFVLLCSGVDENFHFSLKDKNTAIILSVLSLKLNYVLL